MPDISRECAAINLIHCPRCSAPAGSHCANSIATIVWPPHLCRMDAYVNRLHPSEDWPMVALPAENLHHVKDMPAGLTRINPNPKVLWKETVAKGLAQRNNHAMPVPKRTAGPNQIDED